MHNTWKWQIRSDSGGSDMGGQTRLTRPHRMPDWSTGAFLQISASRCPGRGAYSGGYAGRCLELSATWSGPKGQGDSLFITLFTKQPTCRQARTQNAGPQKKAVRTGFLATMKATDTGRSYMVRDYPRLQLTPTDTAMLQSVITLDRRSMSSNQGPQQPHMRDPGTSSDRSRR